MIKFLKILVMVSLDIVVFNIVSTLFKDVIDDC